MLLAALGEWTVSISTLSFRLPWHHAIPRRQTLTALCAPEAEVVVLSEALMPSVVIFHDAFCDVGLAVGNSPELLL